MLRVTPIYGSRWSREGQSEEPNCTLVEYGGCRVLCNVGWWSTLSSSSRRGGSGGGGVGNSASSATALEDDPDDFPELPEHDCLILTDSTLQSLGGLPLYYKQQQLEKKLSSQERDQHSTTRDPSSPPLPPIYATFPTVKMGQMTLYDQHANICLDGGRPPYSLEDLDDVFAAVRCIKYSQTKTVCHPVTGQPSLSVTAHRAGHVVGGAFYLLQRLQDETSVVLTGDYHIARELHLDSSSLLKHGSTPDVLVTHPGGPAFRRLKALAHGSPPALPSQLVTQVERGLMEMVLSVLRREGNVLFPADAAGRVLELILFLDQQWGRQRLSGSYNLCWLGPMVNNTAEFAKCQLEWMAAALGRQFDSLQGHPYSLRNVRLCTTVRELEAVVEESQNNPTCVVASGLSLEGGPARDVLLKWADNPDNAICFTDSSQCFLRQRQRRQRRIWQSSGPLKNAASASSAAAANDATTTTTTMRETTGAVHTVGSDQKDTEAVDPKTQVLRVATPEPQQQQENDPVDGIAPSTASAVPAPDEHDEDVAIVGEAVAEGAVSGWTTAGQLLKAWAEAKAARREMEDSVTVDAKVPHRSPLAGAELKAFLADEEAARRKQKLEEEKRAMLREVELAKGRLRLGEEETTTSTATTITTAATSTAAGASGAAGAAPENKTGAGSTSARPRKKSRFDSSLFLKFSKPLHLTFEVQEEAVGIGQSDSRISRYGIDIGRSGEILEDDYGIAVVPERFTDIVSGVDPSKFAGGSGRIGDEVTRRGFGYGVDGGKKKNKKATSSSSSGQASARVSEDDEDQDDADGMDEQALEAMDLSEGNGIIRGRNGRPPMKVQTLPRKLEVLAEISYIPLEGRVDARAARQSVRALQPRQLVVLGGPSPSSHDRDDDDDQGIVDEVTLLADAAKSFATGSKVVPTPSDGEMVQLAVGHAAYSVRLVDTPYLTREEKEALESPPEPVEPFESQLGACSVSVVDLVATGQKVALDGSLVLAPRLRVSPSASPLGRDTTAVATAGETRPGGNIYLSDGEVLLTDLRAELIAQGMKAEYSAHAGYSRLIVNGKIMVKKERDTGKMRIEGALCEDFYTVRSVLCSQYVTL